MSGHSDSGPCPNCGKSCDVYTDWKPFSYTVMTCVYCGLNIEPTVGYMDLDEINERREDHNENSFGTRLKKLKKLPKQEFVF